MTILQALTSYTGRMSRSDFWLKGILPLCIAAVPAVAMAVFLDFGPFSLTEGWFPFLNNMTMWFVLPLLIKRLHDRNRSAWFLLICFLPILLIPITATVWSHYEIENRLFLLMLLSIPFVGNVWFFCEIGLFRGTVGANRFGNDSLQHNGCSQPKTPAESSVFYPKDFILLILGILLAISLIVIIVAMVPACVNVFRDRLGGRPLPILTQCILDSVGFVRWLCAPVAGFLLGFWGWMSLRVYHAIRSGKASKGKRRWLWSSVIVGVILNSLIGFALSLPFAAMTPEGNVQQGTYEVNKSPDHTR